jgi:hypothetical protein
MKKPVQKVAKKPLALETTTVRALSRQDLGDVGGATGDVCINPTSQAGHCPGPGINQHD